MFVRVVLRARWGRPLVLMQSGVCMLPSDAVTRGVFHGEPSA